MQRAVLLLRAARTGRQACTNLDAAGLQAQLSRSALIYRTLQGIRQGMCLVLTESVDVCRRVPVPWPGLLFSAVPSSRLSTAALWSAVPAPVLPATRAVVERTGACVGSGVAALRRLRGEQLKSWRRKVEELEQRLVAVTNSLATVASGQVGSALFCSRVILPCFC